MTPKLQLLFEQLPDLLGGHLTLAVPAIFIGVLINQLQNILRFVKVMIFGMTLLSFKSKWSNWRRIQTVHFALLM